MVRKENDQSVFRGCTFDTKSHQRSLPGNHRRMTGHATTHGQHSHGTAQADNVLRAGFLAAENDVFAEIVRLLSCFHLCCGEVRVC